MFVTRTKPVHFPCGRYTLLHPERRMRVRRNPVVEGQALAAGR